MGKYQQYLFVQIFNDKSENVHPKRLTWKKKVKQKKSGTLNQVFKKKLPYSYKESGGGHFAFPDQARFAGLFLGQI